MYSSRLRLAVFIALILNYTVAEAKPNVIKRIAQKAVPMATSLTLLFTPPSLDALPNSSPVKPQPPERVVQEKDYVGRAVFFELDGVGRRGIVVASDSLQAQITYTTGPGVDGQEVFKHVVIPIEEIEATLNWDYDVSGNFVVFVPETTPGLETQMVDVPSRIGVSASGELEIDVEKMEEKEIALGTITAVTDDGRYLIKPHHFKPFVADPHDWNGTKAENYRRHRVLSPSLLAVKHFHGLNAGLHLVPKEDVVSGLERLMIEETEINEPFFAFLASDDRMRDANATALQAGQPLPYAEGEAVLPATTVYHTEKFTAADFVDDIIYYYDAEGRKYLAHVIGQRDNKVVVRSLGGRSTKLIAVEQIRASSGMDGNGKLGHGISFFGFDAFPLYHSVHWRGHRLPGARGSVWEEKVLNGSLVAALDNGLLVVKVVENSINGIYAIYNLYVVHHRDGVIHFGNHHHRHKQQ